MSLPGNPGGALCGCPGSGSPPAAQGGFVTRPLTWPQRRCSRLGAPTGSWTTPVSNPRHLQTCRYGSPTFSTRLRVCAACAENTRPRPAPPRCSVAPAGGADGTIPEPGSPGAPPTRSAGRGEQTSSCTPPPPRALLTGLPEVGRPVAGLPWSSLTVSCSFLPRAWPGSPDGLTTSHLATHRPPAPGAERRRQVD